MKIAVVINNKIWLFRGRGWTISDLGNLSIWDTEPEDEELIVIAVGNWTMVYDFDAMQTQVDADHAPALGYPNPRAETWTPRPK